MAGTMSRPRFHDLPLREGDPPFSAWGLYGLDDSLGTLNLLTPQVIVEAAKEIQSGIRIGLDLPLSFLARPPHSRLPLTHKVVRRGARICHDDEIIMNTQISTQWDGFRHYGYQKERLFYNGVRPDEISGPIDPNKSEHEAGYQGPSITDRLGIHAWCERGIAGRGVLLDYYRWSQMQGIEYYELGDHTISVDELEACAKAQNVTFRLGDILLVRGGWTARYNQLSEQEKIAHSQEEPTRHVGVETSIKTARWLWDTGFSACAGDAPGWERWPALPGEGEVRGVGTLRLHEIMLNGWGMPIGKTLLAVPSTCNISKQ